MVLCLKINCISIDWEMWILVENLKKMKSLMGLKCEIVDKKGYYLSSRKNE